MGMRAAAIYFALRLLGYERVRLYDASWEDWSSQPQLPVEPGARRKVNEHRLRILQCRMLRPGY